MLESSALRGVAILGIILHNYCHWLPNTVKENEYTFSGENVRQFIGCFLSFDQFLFIQILSFLGHYGVPVFLFVSGYGLARKYEKDGVSTTIAREEQLLAADLCRCLPAFTSRCPHCRGPMLSSI